MNEVESETNSSNDSNLNIMTTTVIIIIIVISDQKWNAHTSNRKAEDHKNRADDEEADTKYEEREKKGGD